jgi:hypothetical protein
MFLAERLDDYVHEHSLARAIDSDIVTV